MTHRLTMLLVAILGGGVAIASGPAPGAGQAAEPTERHVRVALAIHVDEGSVSATSSWRMYDADGATILREAEAGETWRFIERDGAVLATGSSGDRLYEKTGVIVMRPSAWGGSMVHGGRRYRGEIRVHATTRGVTIVNRLPIDEYLKGVVPVEMGRERTMADFAAVEAQAVAARSYAYVRVGQRGDRRLYDLRPTVADQAYGGLNAETVVATRAVESTAGLVLKYDGRLVNAPYHSTCGGTTAEAPEAWPTRGEPYLRRISDRIAGTDRFYCDVSPRFRWTRQLGADRVEASVARYLREYTTVPRSGPGRVDRVTVVSRTASGRAGYVEIATGRGGPYRIRGNDARFVLRTPGGEILNSARFVVETDRQDGSLRLRGYGYGHGVGMCQWGAIGRARAGQDFRTILATYFPGTVVEPVE